MITTKVYKCQNFGVCPLADKEELIHFDDDDHFQCQSKEHTECPAKKLKCREELVEVLPLPRNPLPLVIAAVVAVALLSIGGLVVFSGGGKDGPGKDKAIAAELKKVWPWLAP